MEKASELVRRDRNRSLERGMEILRAFRPGVDLLGNGELAERTGLSRATVSRLTQTLVDAGFLERDRHQRAYRLAVEVLSLAHAMRSGSPLLKVASPLMRAEAERLKINVGLAMADRDEMVYLESIRFGKKVTWRNIAMGQRIPMELTSLGRSWLSTVDEETLQTLMDSFREKHRVGWQSLKREILASIASVREKGYCCVSWQPEVVALAMPVVTKDHPVFVLNMSSTTDESPEEVEINLKKPLLDLGSRLRDLIEEL